jgi:hypothetical protein
MASLAKPRIAARADSCSSVMANEIWGPPGFFATATTAAFFCGRVERGAAAPAFADLALGVRAIW